MCVLVEGLFKRETSELYKHGAEDETRWPFETHLQAALVNELKLLNHHFVCANSKEGADIPKPKFVKLPGERELTLEEQQERKHAEYIESLTEIPVADLNDRKSFFGGL